MAHVIIHPPKAATSDRVAVLSPSFAAPGYAPGVHEQAMTRLIQATGLVPVEFPTTRQLGASAEARAADVNAAFADPSIRAILASVGGNDQITIIPHLDADLARADPKPFLGYSDNTNLLNWLWGQGVAGFYGGSTQVHLGAGARIDDVHLRSLRAALLTGEELEVIDPGESEDHGWDWLDPRALREFGEREPTESWTWSGPARSVTGRTWGGCLDVLDWIAIADRMPALDDLADAILLLETSEEMPQAELVRYWMVALGERGLLSTAAGVLVARPPVSTPDVRPDAASRRTMRSAQRDAVIDVVTKYNPGAVVCVGPPFGHTRPQWIVPYGGRMTLDGANQTVRADYS